MEEYCVDLQMAKELKENGFPQDSEFYWNIHKAGGGAFPLDDNLNKKFASYQEKVGVNAVCYATYSAPISAEILRELPNEVKDPNFDYYHLKIEKSPINDEMYFISYGITSEDRAWMEYYNTNDKKLEKALAKMWLHLKKEGYINEI